MTHNAEPPASSHDVAGDHIISWIFIVTAGVLILILLYGEEVVRFVQHLPRHWLS
jgi:hypothetical protein